MPLAVVTDTDNFFPFVLQFHARCEELNLWCIAGAKHKHPYGETRQVGKRPNFNVGTPRLGAVHACVRHVVGGRLILCGYQLSEEPIRVLVDYVTDLRPDVSVAILGACQGIGKCPEQAGSITPNFVWWHWGRRAKLAQDRGLSFQMDS